MLLGEYGWLTRRLNYVKSCRKQIVNSSTDGVDELGESMENISIDPQRDYQSLKTEVINKNNRDILVRKLNSTRELRMTLLHAKETDLREQFPFFFAEPQLVSIFFKIMCYNIYLKLLA